MSPTVVGRALEKRFEAVRAVRGLSLSASKGELLGLVGPDGAGKTTTIRMLAGLMRPTGGEVEIAGRDPFSRHATAVREMVGLVPQDNSLYGDLSVEENLQFFARLYCLTRAEFEPRRARLLDITRLGPFTERRASALSGGMYKKLALACALLHQPDVLFLDEPTNGVDPVSRGELWELVYEFIDHGMTVVVSTSYMDEAARCHRVLLVHEGRVIAEGEPARLVRELEYPTFSIEGGDRDAIFTLLPKVPAVVAASPAGERLRVVLEPSGQAEVVRQLGTLGARLAPTRPDFEDLFLARVEIARRAEHA